MFSPFQSASSMNDSLFAFEALPLPASSALNVSGLGSVDFELSNAMYLEGAPAASAIRGAQVHSPYLYDVSSGSGSDPESGSESPSHVTDVDSDAYVFPPYASSVRSVVNATAALYPFSSDSLSSCYALNDTPAHPSLSLSMPALTSVVASAVAAVPSSTASSTASAASTAPAPRARGRAPKHAHAHAHASGSGSGGAAGAAAPATVTGTLNAASNGRKAATKRTRKASTAVPAATNKKQATAKDKPAMDHEDVPTVTVSAPLMSSTASSMSSLPMATLTALSAAEMSGDPSAVVSVPAQKLRKLKEDAELKRKRLDRKAELARNSRRKKKQRVTELEEQVASLQMQLSDAMGGQKELQSHMHMLSVQAQQAHMQADAANAAASEAMQQLQLVQASSAAGSEAVGCVTCTAASATGAKWIQPNDVASISASLACLRQPEAQLAASLQHAQAAGAMGAPVEAVHAAVDSAVMAVNDIGSLTKACVNTLEKFMAPCMPVRVLRWALNQTDKFYQDPNGLWTSLLKQDCGVTPQQMMQLDELRASFKAAASKPTTPATQHGPDTNAVLAAALTEYRQQAAQNDQIFNGFRTILSAEQMVKFLSWVDRYGNVVVRINV